MVSEELNLLPKMAIVLDILLYNASQSHNPMVLHHLEGGTVGPGDRVLRFDSQGKRLSWLKRPTFHRG